MKRLPLILSSLMLICVNSAAYAATDAPDAQAKEYKRQGVQYQSHGQLVKAIDMYQKAIDINPQDASSHNNLGLALKDMDLLDDAEGHLRAAIQLKPEDANYEYNLGIVLMRKSNLEGAEGAFQKAIDIENNDPEFLFRMAQVELLLGKYDNAEKSIREALSIRSYDPMYSELLGDVLLRQVKTLEAVQAYKKAVTNSGPHHNPVLSNKLEYAEYLLQGSKNKSTP
ncbi:MAG TPA: tetratricopeptide repeat protein [Candidatus Obscuribacterales bacterium]